MSFLVRSKAEAPFRRDGASFHHDKWTIVEEPTQRQKAEPMLEILPYNGEATFSGLPVLGAVGDGETPVEPGEVSQAEVDAFLDQSGLVAVNAADFEGLKGDLQDLTAENTKAKSDLADATGKLEAMTAERNAKAEGEQKALADLVEAESERDALKADLAKVQADLDELLSDQGGVADSKLVAAIDAVIEGSASNLGRFTEDILKKLAAAKGINPIPDTKDAIIAALKPAS